MNKIVKFPGDGKNGKGHRGDSSRRPFPIQNCADDETGQPVPKGTVQTLADPREKRKRENFSPPPKVVAEFWVHHRDDGTELRFAQQPDHVPALHVLAIRQYRKGQSEPCGNIEYTVTFNRMWDEPVHPRLCEVAPRSPGWKKCKEVPDAIRERLTVDPARPSTVWVRK